MKNTKKSFIHGIATVCLIFIINTAIAGYERRQDPVQFLHIITDQVLTELRNVNHLLGDNKNSKSHVIKVNKIIDDFVMPYVDFDEMCQWITGRKIWAQSSEEERDDFARELKQLLIKTYSSILHNYSQEKIEFRNYSGDVSAKRIQVKSMVIRQEKENLSVDYRLIATNDSWKVYDLVVEGVSILHGFRAQFSDDIKLNGIQTVTEKIKKHNHEHKGNN
jgi:phospholipid transport system substrate-binding protein